MKWQKSILQTETVRLISANGKDVNTHRFIPIWMRVGYYVAQEKFLFCYQLPIPLILESRFIDRNFAITRREDQTYSLMGLTSIWFVIKPSSSGNSSRQAVHLRYLLRKRVLKILRKEIFCLTTICLHQYREEGQEQRSLNHTDHTDFQNLFASRELCSLVDSQPF